MSEKKIYLRVHGRTEWYSHNYNDGELIDIKNRIISINPKIVYILFNNNHSMLNNAIKMNHLIKG